MLLFAHGIVGRADLPIPVTLFAAAAAAVLVVSFVALALGWSQPRLATLPEKRLFGLPRAVEVLLGALGVFVFFVTVYAGLFGSERPDANLAPTMVYVGFWVGVPFASLLFGDVFRLLSPWRALGRATGWVAGRAGALPEPLDYPERLGRWPAAAGLFAFAICELCWAKAGEPGPLALLMLVYLVVMLVGMSLYGVEPWVRNADAFGVLFGLIGSLAPIGRDAETAASSCACRSAAPPSSRPTAGTVALLVTAVGSTAFDGAREGALFNDLAQDLQRFFADLGFSLSVALELGFVVGLRAGDRDRRRDLGARHGRHEADRRRRRRGGRSARAFGHTLAPIAAGYLVAHYFSLLAYNGQSLWRLASDPLGDGSDLFGGAERGDRLRRRQRHRHLVRPGRRARRRPRRRARARPRPRARALRLGP